MDDMDLEYTIVLSDGIELAGLRMNGNNFISSEELTEDRFELNTAPLTIRDSQGNEEVHDHMELVQLLAPEPGTYHEQGWWFVLHDIPEDELARTELLADIEYIAMMADVDLAG